ncbi:hypothetical protein DI53_3166 [Sphingobacterium deserti]|uniref:Uncharacterized protein n=1 Tax=Sphingobacterium deserti TaxID=1229276 RepID=A0A0B8T5K4_9SPHI|nr:hypothetical protein DI53_3166 [Sphingobacterium deserti]
MCRLKVVWAKACIPLFLILCLACSEQGSNETEIVDNGTKVVFSVFEDDSGEGSGQMQVMSAMNNVTAEEKVVGEEQHVLINNGTMRLTATLVEAAASTNSAREFVKPTVSAARASVRNTKAQTVLGNNVKYRVVLYDRSTTPSTFVSSTLGTAGTPLTVDVVKGKNYDWAVFSYNDQSDPGTSSTTVPSDQRDLLHASGTTGLVPGTPGDGTNANVPISVVLKHKLSAVTVELNSTFYPATITAATATLGSANYFFTSNMDVKTGTLSTPVASTVPTAINLVPTAPAAVKSALFYTSSTSTIANFSVTLNSLSITDQSNQVKTSTTPTNFSWTNVVPTAGKKYFARINVQPVRDISGDNFKILSVGVSPHTLLNTGSSGMYQALYGTSNFGPTGIVPTTNRNWNILWRGSSSGNLFDATTGNYKLIVVGYAAGISDNDATQLINYVNSGGTVLFFTENPGSGPDQRVWRAFAGATASYQSFGDFGNFNQNGMLVGPFGDARGTSFGDQALVGYGTINYDPNLIDVLAFANGSTTNAVVWKSKTRDFYYFGDGGMQLTNDPFLMTASPAYTPRIGAWYTRSNISNSVVVMNFIAKTLSKMGQ